MVIRMRHTSGHTGNRRLHHALKAVSFAKCSNCGDKKKLHTVCKSCGFYRGKNVINKVAKIEKKQAKAKAKTAVAK